MACLTSERGRLTVCYAFVSAVVFVSAVFAIRVWKTGCVRRADGVVLILFYGAYYVGRVLLELGG